MSIILSKGCYINEKNVETCKLRCALVIRTSKGGIEFEITFSHRMSIKEKKSLLADLVGSESQVKIMKNRTLFHYLSIYSKTC